MQINRRFGSHAGVACVTVARMRLKQAQLQAKQNSDQLQLGVQLDMPGECVAVVHTGRLKRISTEVCKLCIFCSIL